MKVKDLIEKLNQMPKDANVCIFDYRKSLNRDNGEYHSEGVISEFDVELETYEKEELDYLKESHDIDFIPWVSISFDNDDYDDEGKSLIEN